MLQTQGRFQQGQAVYQQVGGRRQAPQVAQPRAGRHAAQHCICCVLVKVPIQPDASMQLSQARQCFRRAADTQRVGNLEGLQPGQLGDVIGHTKPAIQVDQPQAAQPQQGRISPQHLPLLIVSCCRLVRTDSCMQTRARCEGWLH